ncbi:MAG TPA: hypothetical protein VFE72_02945 [Lysobacter sp.]|nr:hypothetical protein [Lysobacter sp.]
METSDRTEFAEAMALLFALYDDTPSKLLLEAWWGALAPYPLDLVKMAMHMHATDTQYGHRRPMVADVVRHITETIPQRERDARAALTADLRERTRGLHDLCLKADSDYRSQLISADTRDARIAAAKQAIRKIERDPKYLPIIETIRGENARSITFAPDAEGVPGVAAHRAHQRRAFHEAAEVARRNLPAQVRRDEGDIRDSERREEAGEGGEEAAT